MAIIKKIMTHQEKYERAIKHPIYKGERALNIILSILDVLILCGILFLIQLISKI